MPPIGVCTCQQSMSHVTLSVNEVQHQFVGEAFSLTSPHGLVRHAQHMFILARRKSRSRSLNCLPLSHKYTCPPDSGPQRSRAPRNSPAMDASFPRAMPYTMSGATATPSSHSPTRPMSRLQSPHLASLPIHPLVHRAWMLIPAPRVCRATHACATLDPASPPCTPLRAPTFAHTQPRRFRRNI